MAEGIMRLDNHGHTIRVDLCDVVPINGSRCHEEPCATVTVGPLLSCQRVLPMQTETHAQLRLCPTHVTPFMGMTAAHICCDDAPMTLVWDL